MPKSTIRTHKINDNETVEIEVSAPNLYGGTFDLSIMLEGCMSEVAKLQLSDHAQDELTAHIFHIEVVERKNVISMKVL